MCRGRSYKLKRRSVERFCEYTSTLSNRINFIKLSKSAENRILLVKNRNECSSIKLGSDGEIEISIRKMNSTLFVQSQGIFPARKSSRAKGEGFYRNKDREGQLRSNGKF